MVRREDLLILLTETHIIHIWDTIATPLMKHDKRKRLPYRKETTKDKHLLLQTPLQLGLGHVTEAQSGASTMDFELGSWAMENSF